MHEQRSCFDLLYRRVGEFVDINQEEFHITIPMFAGLAHEIASTYARRADVHANAPMPASYQRGHRCKINIQILLMVFGFSAILTSGFSTAIKSITALIGGVVFGFHLIFIRIAHGFR